MHKTTPPKKFSFLLFFLFLSFLGYSQTIFTDNTPAGTETFTVPAGVSKLKVEVWGGGGKGGSRTSDGGGGGGGGGGYAMTIFNVIPGTSYSYQVGTGSSATSSATVNNSFFIKDVSNRVTANAGTSRSNNNTAGVAGGTAAVTGTDGTGTLTYTGGAGSNASTYGGGGGSSAGTASNGATGITFTGGIATTGGGNGGNGRNTATNGSGSIGVSPGGGGGGSYRTGGTQNGGNGANGQVILTWTCPTYSLSETAMTAPLCAGNGASVTITSNSGGLPTGTYSVSYTLSGTNSGSGTATMTVNTAGTGTFTTSALANPGSTTVTINTLSSGVSPNICSNTISNDNSASASVPNLPTVNAGSDQTLAACVTTATLVGNTPATGTGTWTLVSGTATITTPSSPNSGVTGLALGASATLRWSITNGSCTASTDDVILTTTLGPLCQTYCSPTFTTQIRPITNVTFAGINNTTTNATGGPALQTFTDTAIVIQGSSSNTISLQGNTAGNNTDYYRVYIDWDQNGTFGNNPNETYSIGTILNSTGIDAKILTGNIAVPTTTLLGKTKMRVIKRQGSNPIACQSGSGSGQAEDYIVNIIKSVFFNSDEDSVTDNIDIDDDNDGIKDSTEEQDCLNANGPKANYKFLNETFGTGTERAEINTTYDATTTYCYQDEFTPATCISNSNMDLQDGKYTVGNSAQIASWADQFWYKGGDHTIGDTNGRMGIFNAATAPGKFYTALITGVLPNIPITYSFWAINLDRTDAPDVANRLRPNILVEFRDINDNLIDSVTTGDIQPTNASNLAGDWQQYTASLTLPNVNEFKVIFINNTLGGIGNDLAMDDISITQTLCDTDSDGIPNVFDLDSDNDGIEDIVEAGLGNMSNGKGKVDTTWTDSNNNGMLDSTESNTPLNSDSDLVPNYIDLDSDNDSIFDVDEGSENTSAPVGYTNGDGDITGDGRGDGIDSETFRSKDIDGNGIIEGFGDGILDIYDYGTGINQYGNITHGTANANSSITYLKDSDNDLIPDYLDIKSNGIDNDISKNIQLYDYKTIDSENNGVLDGTTDTDKDGILDIFDTNPLAYGSPRDIHKKFLLEFDGRNDYAEGPVLFNDIAQATLMGWIKLDANFTNTGIVMGQDKFYISINSSRQLVATAKATGLSYTTTALSKDRWYHVAAVYNGGDATGYLRLYLNGSPVQLSTGGGYAGTLGTATNKFTIGRTPGTSSNYFRGFIDEVRVFDTALTTDQIQKMVYQEIDVNGTLIRGTVIPKDIESSVWSNLKAYFRMDNYKNDVIDDYTTTTIDEGTSPAFTRIYNAKYIKLQSAPMPFETTGDGAIQSVVSPLGSFIHGDDVNDIDWSIVKVNHNVTSNSNRTDLGLFVNSGTTYSAINDNKVENSWYLKLDGKIDLQGRSQLVQTTYSELDTGSTGSIERDQQGQTNLYNYNYWSSPVSPINTTNNNTNYTIAGVMKDGFNAIPRDITWTSGYDGAPGDATKPVTLSEYWLYKFESKDGIYANWGKITPSEELRVGQGYIAKGNGGSSNNFTFVGKPNNGPISNNTVAPGKLYLTGNPYPSAIDATQFINDNISSITGTLYFWEHSPDNNTHILVNYKGGYAVRNLLAGLPPVVPSGISGLGLSSRTPNRYIPVGQGFFVYGRTGGGGPVIFNNNQREFVKENHATSNPIFKVKSTDKNSKTLPVNNESEPEEENENKIIRLGYNTNNNYHRQVILGFTEGKATSDIDYGYDARTIDNLPNDMYLLNGTVQLVIEGEGYFDENNSYPIGVKADVDGEVSFKIDAFENFDKEQPIFIYDNKDQTYHDIRTESYKTTITTGKDNNRFSVRFTDKTLGVEEEVTSNDIKVIYAQNSKVLTINNTILDVPVEKVTLYNIIGQLIHTWEIKDQNQQNIQLPIKGYSAGVYISKIKTSKGIMSKKIIVK